MADAATVHKHRKLPPAVLKAEALRPRNLRELVSCVRPGVSVPFVLRPRGGNTASTDCNTSPGGLIIDMSGMADIRCIDDQNMTVTTDAGVRLQDLVATLDEEGYEIPGCFDVYRHTVGGAVAAPCFGAGIGEDAASLARQIVSMRVVTAEGELVRIDAGDRRFMPLFRASYGLLGVIAEVTFRIREKRAFSVKYRRLEHEALLNGLSTLAELPIGLRFFIAPHSGRAWLEVMRPADEPQKINRRAWQARDWGDTVAVPALFRSLQKVVPVASLRYRLIDGVSGLSKDLSQSRFLETGSYPIATGHRQGGEQSTTPLYTTWCFPARKAAEVSRAYIRFCQESYARTGYRCDIPAVGFRVAKDASALLSPSLREPMIALQSSSMVQDGWEDFVIDLADFAEQWAGVPVFNQTRAVSAGYAHEAYGKAIRQFISVRRRLDPNNRLLNPFLAQYFS